MNKRINKTFTTLIFVGYSFLFSAQIPNYVPSNGLVGWWPFNGNANDESGNGNNGTVNGAILIADRFAVANKAFGFNNLNDLISVTNCTPTFNNNAQTLSVWFKFNSQYTSSSLAILKNGTPYVNGFDLFIDQNNGAYGLNNYLVGLLLGNGASVTFISNQSELGQWANITTTYDGQSIKIYLNGILKGVSLFAGSINSPNNNLVIGQWDNLTPPNTFNRNIDDIGIWNRALTQQEITNLYQGLAAPQANITTPNASVCPGQSTTLSATVANPGTPCANTGLPATLQNGLVGYWPFCGNANDASGNGNNGTVNGPTLTADRFGAANNAYSFDGVNDYIGIGNLNLGLSNQSFSVGLWFKTIMSPSGYGYMISDYSSINGGDNIFAFHLGHSFNNGVIYFDKQNMPSYFFQAQSNASYSQWNNLVIVSNALTGSIEYYINGTLIPQLLVNSSSINNQVTAPIYNANYNYSNGQFFRFGCDMFNSVLQEFYKGELDDIGIWSRALNQQEVTQLYQLGQPTYSWSNGASTPSITVSPAQTTTYTCTISMNGATTTQSQTITVNPLPTVNAGQDQTVFAGTQVTLSGSGATSYTWNNGVSNGVPFTANTTTTYTVTGNTNGCTGTDQVLVTVLPAPTLSINTNDSICAGQTTTLTVSAAATGTPCAGTGLPATLQNGLVGYWPFCGNANDASGNGNNGTVNGPTLTADRFGASNNAYSFDGVNDYISLATLNQLNLSSSPFTISIWANSQVFGANNDEDYIIGTPMWGGGSDEGVKIQNNPNGSASGLYSSSLGIGGQVYCGSNNNFNLNQWYNVLIRYNNVNGSFEMFIDGILLSSSTLIGSPLINPYPISVGAFVGPWISEFLTGKTDDIGIWNRALTQQEITQMYQLGQPTYSWSNGATTPSITVSPAQTTTYTCTINMNGGTTTQSQTITVNPLPTVNAGANLSVCTGASVTLSGSGASSYAWNNNVQNGVSFIPNATTTYTVTGTDANGCTNTDQTTLTVNALPTVTAPTNQTVCSGTNVTLTGGGASTYTWINGVTNSVPFAANNTQTYTVTGTDLNGCTNTAQTTVTVNALPTVTATANQAVCAGTSVTLSGSGASSYAWNNNVQNGVSFIPNATTTYTVTGTDANGCTNTDQTTLTVNALPTVTAPTNQTVCSGTNVTLTGGGASTYTWNNGVTNSVPFAANNTQTYTVTGTDVNGCANTAQTTVTVNALPTVTATANQSICSGTSVTLSGSGAISYAWDNGVQDGVIFIPNATTTYTVTGTDANGCTNTAQTTVTVNALPTVNAGANQTVCAGTAATLNGSGAVSYAWNNNVQNGVPFVPNATQTYTVTGTDANGCQGTDQVLVTVASQTTSSITQAACLTYELNGQVYNQSGIYTQTLVNAQGCDSILTLNLTINGLPSIPVVNVGGDNLLSTPAVPNITYQWVFCPSGLSISNQNDTSYLPNVNGSYAVEASNACGSVVSECIIIDNMGIEEVNNPLVIYPNPTPNVLYVQGISASETTYLLFDNQSKLLLEGNLTSIANAISLFELPSGLYHLYIGNHIFKIIKH